jgi:hypothetical protein
MVLTRSTFSGATGGGKSEGLIHDDAQHHVGPASSPRTSSTFGAATFGDWRDRVEVFVDNIEDAAQILVNADVASGAPQAQARQDAPDRRTAATSVR